MRLRLAYGFAALVAILALGTVGYHLIEGARLWDAFYMTVITLTTVGYREVFPLSPAGQGFTAALLLVGLGLIFVLATEVGRSVLAGELRQALGRYRRSRMLFHLQGHEVVCGYGRMGKAVVEALKASSRPLVIVEQNPEKVALLQDAGLSVVPGDATTEEALTRAGIQRARGLVACLADDAHNVYTVLTARSLNPKLFIVARASQEGAEARLLRAGANRVVNPYRLGGLRLAHVLIKPAVVDFLEVSLGTEGEELQLEEARVPESSPLANRSLSELELRRTFGVGVVAIRRGTSFIPNPEGSFRLEAGDVLVVIGTGEALAKFESLLLAQGGGAR
ncbi:MAG: potassium channel family protein [Thermoanaerobaculaceae bacterium]